MAHTPEDILSGLKPRQRIYVQGGPGECTLFYDLLRDNPGAVEGLEIWSCLIPGINALDYGSLPGDVRLATFMASPALAPSLASGRTRLLAMPYSEIAENLARMQFDAAILHTAAPDHAGMCSFGLACDMAPLVWRNAKQRFAFINRRMPSIPGCEATPRNALDLAVEIDEPLPVARDKVSPGGALAELARLSAELVPDGATIQAGIGEAPAAIVGALRQHRGLKVHSGIITQEFQDLAECGAIDERARNTAGVAWGDDAFYRWLPQSGFAFRSARVTHGHDVLAKLDRFVSIGSALEVDLAGNLNLEWRAGQLVSSVGGAPDYLRAAAASPEGMSIIALPATARGASRIVPRLESPSVVGALVDIVVTEHGVARLKGLAGKARAEALVAIAAPEHQEMLLRALRG
jgi:acyl-CoA hydrolase